MIVNLNSVRTRSIVYSFLSELFMSLEDGCVQELGRMGRQVGRHSFPRTSKNSVWEQLVLCSCSVIFLVVFEAGQGGIDGATMERLLFGSQIGSGGARWSACAATRSTRSWNLKFLSDFLRVQDNHRRLRLKPWTFAMAKVWQANPLWPTGSKILEVLILSYCALCPRSKAQRVGLSLTSEALVALSGSYWCGRDISLRGLSAPVNTSIDF